MILEMRRRRLKAGRKGKDGIVRKKDSRTETKNNTKLKMEIFLAREICVCIRRPAQPNNEKLLFQGCLPVGNDGSTFHGVQGLSPPGAEVEGGGWQKEEKMGFVTRENWVQILTQPVTPCMSLMSLGLCWHLSNEDNKPYPLRLCLN